MKNKKQLKRALYFIFILLCSATICACDNVKGGTGKPVFIPHEKFQILNNNVRYLDRELVDRIGVSATNASRTATGTLQIWATFQNHTDFDQCLEVRSIYLSRDKQIVDGPTAWSRVMLVPNGIESYKNNSILTNQVDYYRIEARYCR